MNHVELWSILWIPVSLTLVVLFAFNVERIEGFIARRKRHRPAE
ncbi:hypothetical protein [Undibacter mobilis]|nr:hypothetical protein [Undibacter mobilis]